LKDVSVQRCAPITAREALLLDGATRTLAGARIGAGALATRRQAAAVAQAAVGAEIHQALDADADLAAQVAAEKAGRVALDYGVKSLEVRIKGPGPGRESAVRSLNALGYKVTNIIDVTPIPHNGCRPPKKRRV
jgi:small subunit ribosomal protein S11